MNAQSEVDLSEFEVRDSWAQSVTGDLERSKNRAWIVAIIAAVIAFLQAIALVYLVPLKTVEPYTLLVDRQTGHVEALAPLDANLVAPDAALTRSFLVQYVIARESFDANNFQDDYRKVSLWSSANTRNRFTQLMQANNPQSPLAYMPQGGLIRTEVRSISSLGANRSLVRFTTTRTDPGARSGPPQYWVSVIDFEFSGAAMSEADRLTNPLGFQVTRYRRDAETLPEIEQAIADRAEALDNAEVTP